MSCGSNVHCCGNENILLLHSEKVQSFGYASDWAAGMVTALCGVASREEKSEEEEEEVEEAEHVEMTVWDQVTNYVLANEEVT